MKMLRIAVVGMVFLMVRPGTSSPGQMTQQSQQLPGQGTIPGPPGRNSASPDGNPLPPHVEEQQAQARNSERQKRLVADTNKLLELATDLKAQVDKTNKDTLSVDVIKKADEIEKLAHSVKERMKG
jgi:hypothetical protein